MMTFNPDDEFNMTDRVGDEIRKNKRSASLREKIRWVLWVVLIATVVSLFISGLIILIYE